MVFTVTFTQEYLLLVFISATGIIQIAATYGQIKGLLIVQNMYISTTVGILLIVAPLLAFFWSGGRNIPDTNGGIPGALQFALFLLGIALAISFTYAVTSISQSHRFSATTLDTPKGLESLRETTFAKAIFKNLCILWQQYRKSTKKHSSG